MYVYVYDTDTIVPMVKIYVTPKIVIMVIMEHMYMLLNVSYCFNSTNGKYTAVIYCYCCCLLLLLLLVATAATYCYCCYLLF